MDNDKELKAMANMISAMKDLEPDAQARVINYVLGRLGIRSSDGQIRQISQFSSVSAPLTLPTAHNQP